MVKPSDDGSGHTSRTRPASVKEVAELAGVSWTTVSNVIHAHPHVRPATRTRVEKAIAELGYRPSLAGRQLRQSKTGLIALAIPQINAPYFGELAHAIIGAAREHDYTVLIDETGGTAAHERTVAEGFRVRFIDGIILSPLTLDGAQIEEIGTETPIVLLGERPSSGRLDHVGIDNVRSARELTTHIVNSGCRRIAFLGVRPDAPQYSTGALRLEGYFQALNDAGIEADLSLAFETGAFSRAEGAERMRQILPRLAVIDAVVCANDLLAIGAMHVLRANGIRVPQEVAVAGWDNIDEGAYFSPTLTTVAPDMEHLARQSVELLLRRVAGDSAPLEDVTTRHRLLVRASTRVSPHFH